LLREQQIILGDYFFAAPGITRFFYNCRTLNSDV